MADPKGLKRICMSCGTRFYDLNKKPIVCPSCTVEFTGEIKVKARRGRIIPGEAEEGQVDEEAAVVETEIEGEEIERDDELVSLEDIEEDTDTPDDDDLVLEDDDLDIADDLEDDLEVIDEEEDK